MAQNIGILTAGGDSPGLNAAIRAIGKSAIRTHGMNVIGFLDGFRGLFHDRYVRLDESALSGILTLGGTILGTSRDRPHKVDVGGQLVDMTDLMLATAERHQLDAVVCLGGGGTQKIALRVAQQGLPIVTLPKTIDNDVWGTDTTFGFSTALGIATEAVDRLHSTAHSHHRVVIVEIMGHNAGWLTLGAGLAGGADVVLMPEIPYSVDAVAEAILGRKASGSTFSIVAVAEGAVARPGAAFGMEDGGSGGTVALARALEEATRLESRVTILGHVQRGGTPSPPDRILATVLGTAAADLVAEKRTGVMVAARGSGTEPVPLEDVAGKRKTVPPDHSWIETARSLGINLGD